MALKSHHALHPLPPTLPAPPALQAFWMCMSVLQGGIYFGEFSSLITAHLAWLLLGVLLSLLGAIFMGVSGYAFEQPQNTLAYALSPKGHPAGQGDLEAQQLLAAGRPLDATGVQLNLLAEKLQLVACGKVDGRASPFPGPNSNSSRLGDGYASPHPNSSGGRPWQDASKVHLLAAAVLGLSSSQDAVAPPLLPHLQRLSRQGSGTPPGEGPSQPSRWTWSEIDSAGPGA